MVHDAGDLGRQPCRTSQKPRRPAPCGSMRATTSSSLSIPSSRGCAVEGITADGAHPARTQDGGSGHCQGAAHPEIWTDYRLCQRRYRPRQPCAHPELLVCRVRARLCLRPRRSRGADPRARTAGDLSGIPAQQRQDRHAQLHRRLDQRQLLGLGRPLHGRSREPLGSSCSSTRTSTASCPSCTARVAASPPRARATRSWSARNGGMPAIPTSPRRCSSDSAARCSRSPASRSATAWWRAITSAP